jgi:spore germination protein YaaH
MARLLFLLVTVAGFSLQSQTGAAQSEFERLFYYIDQERSLESLRANIGKIDVIAPGIYNVDEDGVVWGGVDQRVIDLAAEHGVAVMPLIANPGFEQDMLSSFLGDEEARARALNTFLVECRKHGYAGMQFDFENLNINDRDAFTAFFEETAEAFHAEDLKLSIAVVHRPEESPGPTKYFKWLHKNWRAGYDLPALAEAADFISIMTYSQHTRRTPPGPNAGIPWMVKNIDYFLESVPPEKLSLGIAVTTQHWSTEQGDEYVANARSWSKSLAHSEAMSVAERYGAEWIWLDDHKVAYSFFSNGGLFEWIFLEDARSFVHKLDLARRRGLRGFSVWVIGYEDPGIWDLF